MAPREVVMPREFGIPMTAGSGCLPSSGEGWEPEVRAGLSGEGPEG